MVGYYQIGKKKKKTLAIIHTPGINFNLFSDWTPEQALESLNRIYTEIFTVHIGTNRRKLFFLSISGRRFKKNDASNSESGYSEGVLETILCSSDSTPRIRNLSLSVLNLFPLQLIIENIFLFGTYLSKIILLKSIFHWN